MKKRYQVFISSTFADLKEERKQVMQAVLERKCFPAGMELYPAIDKEQFEYVKRVIDESDYYLLIIGTSYGSMDTDGVSWTEKEYNYAVSIGIPVIAFLQNEIYLIPHGKDDAERLKKLKAFKRKVQKNRLVVCWDNALDLKAKVISSLVDIIDDQPQVGWVRANAVVSGDAQKEIDRLKKEIDECQKELQELKADLKEKDMYCRSLEQSNLDARQQLKSLQRMINQLQNESDIFIAQKENCIEDSPTINKSHQEKVNDVADGIGKILDLLKGDMTTMKLMPLAERITILGTDVSFKMVHVEGGTFMMGANEDDKYAESDEKPAHQVTLSDYWIGETQVTQELWEAVMGVNPSSFAGHPDNPVERVSWNDCQAFIAKLNEITGKKFRLPTEAEWEFAARGGNKSDGFKYAGSNYCTSVAWYDANSGRTTHAVALKAPNELGLYDMSGNVYEWCQDMYGHFGGDKILNPTGPSSGTFRVSRGGSWAFEAEGCRISYRISFTPMYASNNLGLRLAL